MVTFWVPEAEGVMAVVGLGLLASPWPVVHEVIACPVALLTAGKCFRTAGGTL